VQLVKAGYIELVKSFRGKMSRTTCRMTDVGRAPFAQYVAALESYIGR